MGRAWSARRGWPGLRSVAYGLRDARLRLLSHGFKEVFLVESRSRGRFVLKTYGTPPEVGEEGRSDPRYRTGPGLRSPETIEAQLHWLSAWGARPTWRCPSPCPCPTARWSAGSLSPTCRRCAPCSAGVGPHRELYPPNHPPRHFALLALGTGRAQGGPDRRRPLAGRPAGGGTARPRRGLPAPRRLRAPPLGLELALRGVGPAVGGGPGVLLDGGDGRLRGGVATRPREPRGFGVRERGLRAHTPRPHPYEPPVWWARRGPAAGGGGDGF
jgi:hypothetical protein